MTNLQNIFSTVSNTATDAGWNKSNFLILLAASIPVSGALLVQIFESKTARRQSFDEKRLVALLAVRLAVEEACGRWYAYADATLNQQPSHICEEIERGAAKATHAAWYATRSFEMFFPTMLSEAQMMRDEILRCKNISISQIRARGDFNGEEFEQNKIIDLDIITQKGRKILGYPNE
jgi:hypothetical protein